MSPRFVLLLLTPASAFAQAAPAPALPQLVINQTGPVAWRTKADTMQAIQHLFHAKRTTGYWLVGSSVATTALTGIGTAAGGQGNGFYFNPLEASTVLAIGTAPAWIPGTISLIRFSARREQKTMARYSQQGSLPAYVRKRLKNKYFRVKPAVAL